jgi:hypothetical protein
MATTGNPLSGHTAANYTLGVDGLRDGDQILSASFTNILEGVHGNGILMLEGGAVSGTDRNNPDFLPGAVKKHISNAHQIVIQGGYAILDGTMYEFADGYDTDGTPDDITIDLTSGSANKTGTTNTLTNGKECLFTIFVNADDSGSTKHIRFQQSSLVDTGTGVYPSSPNSYLIDDGTSTSVKDTIVLATVRAIFETGTVDAANTLAIRITEINDKRVFLKPSPMFITPLTKGIPKNKDSANSINSHTDLDALHTEGGDFSNSPFGAIWMSHSTDKVTGGGTRLGDIGDDVLFFASHESDGTAKTLRLAPDRIYTGTPSGVNHFTHDGPNIFIIAPSASGCTLNPDNTSNEFAPGSIVYIRNTNSSSGHPVNFDTIGASALNYQITGGQSAIIIRNNSSSNPKWSVLINASTSGTGAVSALNNATENELVTVGNTTTELDAEALLTFDGATLEVGASGNGADLLLHSATAAHVGVKWDHDDQTDGSLTLGVDDHGIDFKAYGETSGKLIHWDASTDTFFVTSTLDIDGPVTVGVDDTGYDVKFFGATAGAYMLWDESQDDLILGGGASLGIGDTAPGTQLQITADGPKITLKNSVDENGDGGAESTIIFEDHTNAHLASIEGSHDGTNDDTKGKLILSTHNGTSLTTALTINSAQKTTLAGEVVIGGDLTVNGTTTTINSTTMTTDNIILTLGGDTAPTQNDAKDKGIEFRYYDSQARIGFFGYDESAANFTFLTAATNANNVFSGTKGTINANLTGNMSSGTVSATTITGSDDLNIDSGLLFVDVSADKVGINQATPLTQLQIDKVGVESVTLTGSSTADAVHTLFTRTQFRGCKLFISTKTTDDDTGFEFTEVAFTHNGQSGGSVYRTAYATVNHGADVVGTHTIDINGDNVRLTLNYNQIGGVNKNFTTEIAWIGMAA